jgi:hypothetical protein
LSELRKRCRAVLIVPSCLSDLAPHLRRKNFYPTVLPACVLDQELKGLGLSGRTLVTDKPGELAIYDFPVLEFSLIDITLTKADCKIHGAIRALSGTKIGVRNPGHKFRHAVATKRKLRLAQKKIWLRPRYRCGDCFP